MQFVINGLQHANPLYGAIIYLKSVPEARVWLGHPDCYLNLTKRNRWCLKLSLPAFSHYLSQPKAIFAWGEQPLLLPPSSSIGTDPKQTVAESNVPSTQTGFSVKESASQSEFILCCVEGRTNGPWDSRRGKERERLERKGGRVTQFGSVDSSVTYTVL